VERGKEGRIIGEIRPVITKRSSSSHPSLRREEMKRRMGRGQRLLRKSEKRAAEMLGGHPKEVRY